MAGDLSRPRGLRGRSSDPYPNPYPTPTPTPTQVESRRCRVLLNPKYTTLLTP